MLAQKSLKRSIGKMERVSTMTLELHGKEIVPKNDKNPRAQKQKP
jgi:hypothetical protein